MTTNPPTDAVAPLESAAPAVIPPQYPMGYYGAALPSRALSIASMILGIAGAFLALFFGLGFFPSIAAVITGHLARRRQPHARGFSLVGLICGYAGIVISVLWIACIVVLVIAFPATAHFHSTVGTVTHIGG